MKQEVCVLPVKCEKCGSIFDLWYDLAEQERGSGAVLALSSEMALLRETLCWRCRQTGVGEMGEEEMTDELMLDYD